MFLRDLLIQSRIKAEKDARRKAVLNATIGVGIGAVIGTAVGILFAPKSGKKTREQIAKGANEVVSTIKEKIEKTHETIAEELEKQKSKFCAEDAEKTSGEKTSKK